MEMESINVVNIFHNMLTSSFALIKISNLFYYEIELKLIYNLY